MKAFSGRMVIAQSNSGVKRSPLLDLRIDQGRIHGEGSRLWAFLLGLPGRAKMNCAAMIVTRR